jgi:hypothetical protein
VRAFSIALVAAVVFTACDKSPTAPTPKAAPAPAPAAPTPNPPPAPPPAPRSSCQGLGSIGSVLVDASHDGGVWWFPQSGPFDANDYHQGWELAMYLRSRGYRVDEVGRGSVVSRAQLLSYRIVVRAVQFGPYTADEIAAYVDFVSSPYVDGVSCPRTLILLGEYLRPGERDQLAEALGVRLAGMVWGSVTDFTSHSITEGMSGLSYDAGSALASTQSGAVQILGRLDSGAAVMGVIEHSTSKIFFIGDTNGAILSVPQPLVDNLIAWGF